MSRETIEGMTFQEFSSDDLHRGSGSFATAIYRMKRGAVLIWPEACLESSSKLIRASSQKRRAATQQFNDFPLGL
jgi:hypothetical protein